MTNDNGARVLGTMEVKAPNPWEVALGTVAVSAPPAPTHGSLGTHAVEVPVPPAAASSEHPTAEVKIPGLPSTRIAAHHDASGASPMQSAGTEQPWRLSKWDKFCLLISSAAPLYIPVTALDIYMGVFEPHPGMAAFYLGLLLLAWAIGKIIIAHQRD